MTALLVDIEMLLGGPCNWNFFIFHGIVKALLIVTAEVLVTFLGNSVTDIRRVDYNVTSVKLGCFGGAYDNSTY